MLGIKDATATDNAQTLNVLEFLCESTSIHALNITNFSDYSSDTSDADERLLIKSWHNTDKSKLEAVNFATHIYKLNKELLDVRNK